LDAFLLLVRKNEMSTLPWVGARDNIGIGWQVLQASTLDVRINRLTNFQKRRRVKRFPTRDLSFY